MTSVVIVPSLRSHLHRHQQTHRSHNSRKHRLVHRQPLLKQVNQCRHTDAAPDGKGVERSGISIVTLAGLHGSLVEINNDGQSRHEKQKEHHPELSDTSLSAEGLPKQSDEP